MACRHTILDVLSWDLRACAEGVFPVADHTGRLFPPDSPEGQRAHQPIAEVGGIRWKAHFAYWKGDQEAAAATHDSRPLLQFFLGQCFLKYISICVCVPLRFTPAVGVQLAKEATTSYRHTFICDWCFASKTPQR